MSLADPTGFWHNPYLPGFGPGPGQLPWGLGRHSTVPTARENLGPGVHKIRTLSGWPEEAEARRLMEQVVGQVDKLMRRHKLVVPVLVEAAYNTHYGGLNVGGGGGRCLEIHLVLRKRTGKFYDSDWILGVMLHELAHNHHSNHGPKFQALMDQYTDECLAYTLPESLTGGGGSSFGEGKGRQLGGRHAGRDLGPGQLRDLAAHAARKRQRAQRDAIRAAQEAMREQQAMQEAQDLSRALSESKALAERERAQRAAARAANEAQRGQQEMQEALDLSRALADSKALAEGNKGPGSVRTPKRRQPEDPRAAAVQAAERRTRTFAMGSEQEDIDEALDLSRALAESKALAEGSRELAERNNSPGSARKPERQQPPDPRTAAAQAAEKRARTCALASERPAAGGAQPPVGTARTSGKAPAGPGSPAQRSQQAQHTSAAPDVIDLTGGKRS